MEQKTFHRLFEIVSFIILSLAFVLSLILEADSLTWIPFAKVSVPVANGLCALACIPLMFKPGIYRLECGILLVQSFFTCWTGYETLGVFLYSAMIITLFSNGFFQKYMHRRLVLLIVGWIVCLFGVIPYGLARCLLVYATFLFMLAFNYAFYLKFKETFSPLVQIQSVDALIKLPEAGETINIAECGFTERQLQILEAFLNENATYKELSDRFYISVSTVKKEMAYILHQFGISTSEELRKVFALYNVVFDKPDKDKENSKDNKFTRKK